ncbi:MAG: hypothetical protein Q9190_000125 [Brigantiaea leucoxantha]
MKRKSTAVSLLLLSLTNPTIPCSIAAGTKFTAYGYPDADGIPAYACKGSQPISSSAGEKTMLGDGSFEKPYAAAAALGSVFQECELVYVPLLKKYFRIQDNCGACVLLTSALCRYLVIVSEQIDLYIAQANSNIGQTNCEKSFGAFEYSSSLHEVVRDPDPGYPVNSNPSLQRLFTFAR